MKIPKNDKQLLFARILRREMTPHEKKLWYCFLRKYPVKIYKQRIIDSYIADFYCASANLVIELDGSQHFEEQGKEYDAIRNQVFAQYGLYTLRFTNLEIDREFDRVCKIIDFMIQDRLK